MMGVLVPVAGLSVLDSSRRSFLVGGLHRRSVGRPVKSQLKKNKDYDSLYHEDGSFAGRFKYVAIGWLSFSSRSPSSDCSS